MSLVPKIILAVIVLVKLISGQVISKIKCEDYSKLDTNLNHPYPHNVGVGILDSGIYYNLCGGILISESFVLVAIDCVDLHENVHVVFSTDDIIDFYSNNINDNYPITKVHKHPVYNGSFGYFDIGLLELDTVLSLNYKYRPACLWTDEFIINKPLYTSGWGGIYPGEEHRERFKIFRVSLLQNNECAKHYSKSRYFPNGVYENQLCINATDRTYSICDTLPGNPIELVYKNNFHVIGIISFTNTVCEEAEGKIASRISSFVPWIESVMWPEFKSFPNCGNRKIKHKPLITFGDPSYHGQFPWHAAINRRDDVKTKKYICGGTLISLKNVITAAHCVYAEGGLIIPSRLTVELGKHQIDLSTLDSREYEIYEVIPHEHYDSLFLNNDIAILVLKTIVQFTNYIQPICLSNTTTIFQSNIGVVPGFGRDEQNTPAKILNYAPVPILPNELCRTVNRDFFSQFLNDNNFCGGYMNGTGVCSGDSGSGLVMEINERFYLRGIVSLGVAFPGDGRCDITQPALFTDVGKFYDWIITII